MYTMWHDLARLILSSYSHKFFATLHIPYLIYHYYIYIYHELSKVNLIRFRLSYQLSNHSIYVKIFFLLDWVFLEYNSINKIHL